jgi:hypothetical protein
MVKAQISWITDPELKSNRKLLGYLNGEQSFPLEFFTPYIVERPGKPALTVEKKYVFTLGEVTEYFYQVDGPKDFVQELCNRAGDVNFQPLELTYMGDLTESQILGMIEVLKKATEHSLWRPNQARMKSFVSVEKVSFERFEDPNYIVFCPLIVRSLSEEYQQLQEYRDQLPNPLGGIRSYNSYEPMNFGNTFLSPIYLSEERIFDIRSKIDLDEIVGYTLLHDNLLVYAVLDEWSEKHEYDAEVALKNIKTFNDLVLVKNHLVYHLQESIYWDLKSLASYANSKGWIIIKEKEVQLQLQPIYTFL